MKLRDVAVASFLTLAAAGGCFPSFEGLSRGTGTGGHGDGDASTCGLGDACDDLSCDGQPCSTLAGTALQFDGNQVVRVAPGPVSDMTIEMWLKTTQLASNNSWFDGAALYQADKPGPANDFGASIAHDKFAFGTGNPDNDTALSKTSINTGAWFHVAATRVQSTGIVRVYVNGNLETIVSTGNTGPLNDAQPPWIGGMIYTGETVINSFVGTIDELRVWNLARTSAEITSTMNVRLRGDEPGLVGCWHFDDGMGTIAADSSATRNDGSLGYGYPDLAPSWKPSDAPLTSQDNSR
jgi:hypothetical protein